VAFQGRHIFPVKVLNTLLPRTPIDEWGRVVQSLDGQ